MPEVRRQWTTDDGFPATPPPPRAATLQELTTLFELLPRFLKRRAALHKYRCPAPAPLSSRSDASTEEENRSFRRLQRERETSADL